MAARGTKMRLWPLHESARRAPETGRYPTNRCLNPLTSFVQHMICHNCVSAGRGHHTASSAPVDNDPSLWEKDDSVARIEKWEADDGTNAA